jgi:chromosome segregation ATPase
MDGGYSSVTFICSKTDDISLIEATSSLGLEDEMGELWEKSESFSTDIKNLKKELDKHKTSRGDYSVAIDEADEKLEIWMKLRDDAEDGKTVYHPIVNSAKRKRPAVTSSSRKKSRIGDSDDDFIDDDSYKDNDSDNAESDDGSNDEAETRGPLTEEDVTIKIAELKDIKRNGRQERLKLDEKIQDIKKQIDDLKRESDVIDATITASCIAGRNNCKSFALTHLLHLLLFVKSGFYVYSRSGGRWGAAQVAPQVPFPRYSLVLLQTHANELCPRFS